MSQSAQRVLCGGVEQTPLPAPRSPLPVGTLPSVVAFVLGATLFSAALLKGRDLVTRPALDDTMVPAQWFWMAVVDFEVVLGVWLLLIGFTPRAVWKLTVVWFAALACGAAWKGFSGASSCGCLGLVISVNPWYMLAADVIAGAALIAWRPLRATLRANRRAVACRWGLALPVMAAAVYASLCLPRATAHLSNEGSIVGDGGIVVLYPNQWLGEPFPLIDHIEFDGQLDHGQWVVVLFRRGCPDCRRVIEKWATLAGLGSDVIGRPNVALVEVPPFAEDDTPLTSYGRSFAIGKLTGSREWLVATPVEITLSKGIVKQSRDSSYATLGDGAQLPGF